MKYYSTRGKNNFVSFKTAVIEGLSNDGGLFMPESIPLLPLSMIQQIENYSLREIGYEISKYFIDGEIPDQKLSNIVEHAINFDAPLVELSDNLSVLELFHGPTLAFKDFGARFMAKTMEFFAAGMNRELNILVATSGDTGSAVAHGFYGAEGIKVFILYPKGKVSFLQEKQLTTLDKNITAIEVNGTFDDCQSLVKEAFVDEQLKSEINLSSANSINIARLIPQSFYFINAYKQLKDKNKPAVISVPSGNLGNITAGLMAKKMGLPVLRFIGAANKNDVFTEFITDHKFNPRKSVQTLSNAMDVGNPSNLERIVDLYNNNIEEMRKDISSSSWSDEETEIGIKEVFEKYSYIIDPHGAVGYQALKYFLANQNIDNVNGIVVETAHPAKFNDIVEKVTQKEIIIPDRLAVCITKEKKSIQIKKSYNELKNLLLNT
ncbi:MAG: threonine synthase [Ignavibacteriae bacterium HGW-Ignavibacteriae-3]|nr:MAG: threonine synthase [Ignavibacteriae bacterium HGW-Ignavibacteriae-3]